MQRWEWTKAHKDKATANCHRRRKCCDYVIVMLAHNGQKWRIALTVLHVLSVIRADTRYRVRPSSVAAHNL
jgi:hypothetical protein